jgi:C-terminal processing protease CtpA/Prc
MFAFPATKRTFVLMMSIALVVMVPMAQAGDDEEKGYLGVMLQELTPSMSKALQMGDKSGVMINEVVADSPAAKAGLEDGDVILEFNGKTIADDDDLVKAVRSTSPGETVEVVVLRNGRNKTLDVEIGQREDKDMYFLSEDEDWHAPHIKTYDEDGHKVIVMSDDDDFTWTANKMKVSIDEDRGYLGVHLDDLNEQLGEFFGVEDGEGALVTEVVEDSPAASAGLKAGDVIIQLGQKEIESAADLHQAMADTEPEQQLEVRFVRRGQTDDVSITLGELPEDLITKHIEIIGDGDKTWSIHTAPSLMKHFDHDGDVDMRVIRRGVPEAEFEWQEMQKAQEDLQEMREELNKMKQELKKMQKELQKEN